MTSSYKPESKDFLDWIAQRVNRHETSLDEINKSGLVGVWMNPTFVNSWANVGGTEHLHQYRLFNKDTLEIRGTITGGASGTVAYTLLRPFWPDKDVHMLGSALAGAVVKVAIFNISSTTGQVTVNV